jgi:plastocyanin
MGIVLFFLILIGPALSHAQQTSQESFVGCFNRLPNGALQFGVMPSGELFAVRDNTKLASEHVNQLVRVFGNLERSKDNNAPATLTLLSVQTLAATCTSVVPPTTSDRVPGKVGEDTVAVPRTDTSTEDQTTPGFQTQSAATANAHPNSPAIEPLAAPPAPEQVGQSEASGNVNARSVERTEILPGATLGASGSNTGSPTGSQNVTGSSAEPSAHPVTVTIQGDAVPQLVPAKVSIRAGQTIAWVNSSSRMQEIIANPARETQVSGETIPAGAEPFDSGFVRPDHSFEHQFSVPGVYHYVCKVNNSALAMGEIVVVR